MKLFSLAMSLGLLAGGAFAEPLSFSEARKVALDTKRTVAVVTDVSFLEEKELNILKGLRETIPFYGAVALSPSEGLYVEWVNASGQFHSREGARQAALAHCEDNRKPESQSCVVVLEVLPRGAKDDLALTLSGPAASALRKEYRKLEKPRAFAISDKTGNFGFARGDGARAISGCASQGATDCRIVVAD